MKTKNLKQQDNPFYEIRKQIGLSQHEVAEAMQVSQSYVTKVERGLIIPSLTFVKDFCCVLLQKPESMQAIVPSYFMWRSLKIDSQQ